MISEQKFIAATKPYFCGNSPALRDMLDKLPGLTDKPLFVYGAPGTGKRALAHALDIFKDSQRNLSELDLNTYTGAERETQVWTALKDILKVSSAVYIRGLDAADILFLISILEWLSEQENLRVIVAVESQELLENIPPEFFAKYELLSIPPLKDRKEDLPLTVEALLGDLENRYGTRLKYLENQVWNDFLCRDWSGNIDELRYNLEAVVIDLPPSQEVLHLAELIKSAD
jgi:transcriptional regulator with AAA-type ATPase domain